jgi:hypothetical protein
MTGERRAPSGQWTCRCFCRRFAGRPLTPGPSPRRTGARGEDFGVVLPGVATSTSQPRALLANAFSVADTSGLRLDAWGLRCAPATTGGSRTVSHAFSMHRGAIPQIRHRCGPLILERELGEDRFASFSPGNRLGRKVAGSLVRSAKLPIAVSSDCGLQPASLIARRPPVLRPLNSGRHRPWHAIWSRPGRGLESTTPSARLTSRRTSHPHSLSFGRIS